MNDIVKVLFARCIAILFATAATLLPTLAQAEIRINEVYVNPPGTDDNREFIELVSTTGGVEPLTNLTLLIIDSAGSTIGGIDDAYNLAAFSTGVNGLLLLGNNFPVAPVAGPYNALVDPRTALADPTGAAPFSGMGPSDLGNNGFTLFLVRGFSGTVSADLDTNNDGTFETTPWTSIVDSVGWRVGNGGTNGDWSYALAELSRPTFTPDTAARLLGDFRANATDAWYGGDIGVPDTAYDATQNFRLPIGAKVTVGSANFAAVPEPTGLALLSMGCLGIALVVRRLAH